MPQHDDVAHTPELTRREAVRRLLAAGLSVGAVSMLAACSSSGPSRSRSRYARRDLTDIPDPEWPAPRNLTLGNTSRRNAPSVRAPQTPRANGIDLTLPSGVRTRDSWAGGDPVPEPMDKQSPINRITVHHDGMTVFTTTSLAAAQTRLEAIRSAHRGRGWGDIGYHYAVDPAGRIWECRPLSWSGAHVGGQNPGNIGICVLGNYEKQRPTDTQLSAVEDFVQTLMRKHSVDVREIYTHRELASTACPGRYLQPRLVAMRESNGVLARV